ncbi:MAG: Fe2+-dependent dioxygenase [Arenicellales bacterium]
MLIIVPSVLNQEQLGASRQLLSEGTFIDGRLSAGEQARRHKNNQEFSADDKQTSALNNLVMGALISHPVYLNAGLPRRIAAPYYCRYLSGMAYGSHIDDPIMGQGDRYRCDIAITVFLNGPDEYQGGELEIETEFGSKRVKLEAGDAVMYPASSRHSVNEVASGERLVAVTWMQSLVRESDKRSLLYQLYLAKESLRKSDPDAEVTHRVDQSYVNLVRMWSCP